MSEIENVKIINKNNKSVKWIKFPSSVGIFSDILFEYKDLNNKNE